MRLGRPSPVVLGVFAVCGVLVGSVFAGGAATSALGPPPRACGNYEYATNLTCLVQSRAMTFTITPKQVAPGGIVTATAAVIFDAPGNGGAAVSWSWDSLIGSLGARQPGCGPEKGSSPLVSKCSFKAGVPTNGWRTVILDFGTYIGPAVSRDYFAIVGKATPTPPPKPTKPKTTKKAQIPKEDNKKEPKKPCPAPAEPSFLAGGPKGAIGRVAEVDGSKAWIQHKGGKAEPLTFKTWVLPGDIILTDPKTVVAVELVTGGRVGLNKDVVVRIDGDGRVMEIPNPSAAFPQLEQEMHTKRQVVNKLGKIWDKINKRPEPLEFDVPGGSCRG
jgi:hypothetical protein